MLRFYDKLSPRQRFWLGFACCPLITFISTVLLVLIFMLGDVYPLPFSGNWHGIALVFFGLSGLVYLIGLPVFSGFGAAFFWRHFSYHQSGERHAVFWSVALAWSPVIVCVPAWPFFLLPFAIFFVLYVNGMSRGVEFWNSNRPGQWIGDFSDLGPRDER